MTGKKVGDVIRRESKTYKDHAGRDDVQYILIANSKCPKWYFKILKDIGIKIEQE